MRTHANYITKKRSCGATREEQARGIAGCRQTNKHTHIQSRTQAQIDKDRQ